MWRSRDRSQSVAFSFVERERERRAHPKVLQGLLGDLREVSQPRRQHLQQPKAMGPGGSSLRQSVGLATRFWFGEVTHEEGLRGRHRRDLVRVKLQLEGDLMRKKKSKLLSAFFFAVRELRERRERSYRTPPVLALYIGRHGRRRLHRGRRRESLPRKNEDPQFELRFRWRGTYRFGSP